MNVHNCGNRKYTSRQILIIARAWKGCPYLIDDTAAYALCLNPALALNFSVGREIDFPEFEVIRQADEKLQHRLSNTIDNNSIISNHFCFKVGWIMDSSGFDWVVVYWMDTCSLTNVRGEIMHHARYTIMNQENKFANEKDGGENWKKTKRNWAEPIMGYRKGNWCANLTQ